MGKFRSKLKGQTKGKRWPKGQSSSSNPETKKYREAAKSRFFQENLGPSNLTSDALKKHDVINSFAKPKVPSEPTEMDEESMSQATSFRTIQTFASDWSECSNMSFSRLLRVFRPDSALHKEMLAVLAAITEVIKQNGGSETSTEYYAALMTTLEVSETEESLCAILSLLNMGMKSVSPSVLKLQFAQASKVFVDLMNNNINSENNAIIKSLLGILTSLLRVQELAIWNNPSTMQIFNTILAFALHSKPKIRKSAQQDVCAILKGSCFMTDDAQSPAPVHHPAAVAVAEFCVREIEAATAAAAGQTTMLHALALLKDVIHTFPKAHIKSSCETILKVMTLNNPLVTSCGMQVLHALFSAQAATIPAVLNGQLISALYEYQPSPTDTQPVLAWILVMQQAHVHLADVDIAVSCTALPKVMHTLTQLWLSERPEVMNAATRGLQVILEDCVGPACATSDMAAVSREFLRKGFSAVEVCLGYQYNRAWHQVLHVIASMFKVAGKYCSDLLINCLKTLAELRDSYKFSYNNELEFAVGAAIKSMGPDVVLGIISLKKNENEINIDRSWLLPVLKENVQYSTLDYYVKHILPLAIMCQKKSTQLSANHDGIGAHSYELLYMQLWNLLPCFCNNPTDVKENFKSIAKILGTTISEKKDLRLAVMASLRKLIASAKEAENEEEIVELSRFAKNYLPILFNLYTTMPKGTDEVGQRLAALDTVKVYLSISPPELQTQLFTHALEQLKSTTEPSDIFIKESILDIIRVLSIYQDSSSIHLLYDQCVKNLVDLESHKEQKKAYRLLEEICASESEGCKKFMSDNRKLVQKLLMKSLSNAAATSKGARLRCLHYLVKSQPHLDHESKLLRAVIPEAVLCCKDINKKCRLASYDLLSTVGETLQKQNQMSEFVVLLVAGMAGTPQMISATILALASVTHNFSGSLGAENITQILETVCQLMKSTIREVVVSCLSFIKVYLTSLPAPIVASSLPTIITSLTSMTEDCKRHNRLKVRYILDRLVRKYGCDSITPHVPLSDIVMRKRLSNLRKLNARKKKQKEAGRRSQEDVSDDEEFTIKAKPRSMEDILADSDSDLDGMDIDEPHPNKRKTGTWIREDVDSILDFTDPSAVGKITTTRPGMSLQMGDAPIKAKDRGFKTAPDGRLIIAGNDDDSDDDRKKKGMLKLVPDSDDSGDENKSAAETAIMSNKKRKRSDVDSMKSGVSGTSLQASKYKAGGSGIHRPVKASGSVYTDAGTEYKSKKAKGDVKKKGKVDPYAYLPLTRSNLNKRKKVKNSGQFKNIVKAAKKGAKKGTKAGKKGQR